MRSRLRELAAYGVVGASNTALSAVLYAAFRSVGAERPLAGALAFAAGAVNGWWWNGRWTFRARGSVARYAVVAGLGLAATALLLAAGLAYVATLVLVTIATYLLNRRWTFRLEVPGDTPMVVTWSSPRF
jgi:putative flippase GtrA